MNFFSVSMALAILGLVLLVLGWRRGRRAEVEGLEPPVGVGP
jgi:hypothetical protein